MPAPLTLIDYWRSGTSHRVRIALALKGLSYARRHVDLRTGAQRGAEHLAVNPQGLAPVLLVGDAALTQTPAILEWLEETYPDPPLLPAEPLARARVRALAGVVACDIHPLGNLRVLNYLRRELGHDDQAAAAFASRWIADGFAALERLLASAPPGPWAWGETPTLADCCIAPQLYAAADRYGITPGGRLGAIAAAAQAHPAFIAAHPLNQPDAPKAN